MHHDETGFSDVMYDLVAVQYHALKGGQNHAKYVEDARSSGQQEIVEFFTEVQQEDADRAARCRLGERGVQVSPGRRPRSRVRRTGRHS